jgi:hypothetical protein
MKDKDRDLVSAPSGSTTYLLQTGLEHRIVMADRPASEELDRCALL